MHDFRIEAVDTDGTVVDSVHVGELSSAVQKAIEMQDSGHTLRFAGDDSVPMFIGMVVSFLAIREMLEVAVRALGSRETMWGAFADVFLKLCLFIIIGWIAKVFVLSDSQLLIAVCVSFAGFVVTTLLNTQQYRIRYLEKHVFHNVDAVIDKYVEAAGVGDE